MVLGADNGRPSVLVFGGTSEGYDIAEWLGARGTCDVVVSSLTEYGGSLVHDLPNVGPHATRRHRGACSRARFFLRR